MTALAKVLSSPAPLIAANDNACLQLVVNNANRTSHTIAGTTTPYTTLPSTNKLTNLGAQAITTNLNGSVTTFAPAQPSGLTTLTYNAAGRVATASSASATLTTNTYDATGMRVRKVAGATTSRFVRGLGGELLQEVTGSTRRNYIYANGVPVAQLNGTTLHYLHTDQRGVPVKATNASRAVRWSTRYEPFGATVGLTNPGSLVMNLRLPGQYADSESGLYDNGFRTYNPATGRYLQSDPIGLAGGSNTYGYVTGNPFKFVDPWGLEVDATYDRESGTLRMRDVNTGKSISTDAFSGNGEYVNNPIFEGLSDRGPLPSGNYLIGNGFDSGHGGNDWWYTLYGPDGSGGYSKTCIAAKDPFNGNKVCRSDIYLHTGLASNGCLTVPSDIQSDARNYPQSEAYDKIRQMLDSTKPINYKGSQYRGWLRVQ